MYVTQQWEKDPQNTHQNEQESPVPSKSHNDPNKQIVHENPEMNSLRSSVFWKT